MQVKDVIKKLQASLDRPMTKAGPIKYDLDNVSVFLKDAYDRVTHRLRKPIASVDIDSVANQFDYDLPADCYDNFNGIISMTYESRPVTIAYYRQLEQDYFEYWDCPPGMCEAQHYLLYEDITKFRLIRKPSQDDKTIHLVYVQETPKPTSLTDTIPAYMQPFEPYLEDFIAGKVLGPRGASKVSAFEQLIISIDARDKRSRPRRTGQESFTKKLKDYRINYGRNRRQY